VAQPKKGCGKVWLSVLPLGGVLIGRPLAAAEAQSGTPRLRLDCRLVDQHDRDVISYCVDAVAQLALEGLRVLSIFEGLFTGRTDQDLQKVFIYHDMCIVTCGVHRMFRRAVAAV